MQYFTELIFSTPLDGNNVIRRQSLIIKSLPQLLKWILLGLSSGWHVFFYCTLRLSPHSVNALWFISSINNTPKSADQYLCSCSDLSLCQNMKRSTLKTDICRRRQQRSRMRSQPRGTRTQSFIPQIHFHI